MPCRPLSCVLLCGCLVMGIRGGQAAYSQQAAYNGAVQAATGDARVAANQRVYLGFSRDGRLLHVVGFGPSDDSGEKRHVRVVTYAAKTGAVVHLFDLDPDTSVLASDSDGGRAIVASGEDSRHLRLFLLDTETGRLQDFPKGWYSPDDDLFAALSGDGRLVSVYTESGLDDKPMVVTVYDWRTKAVIAKRTSRYVAAGGAMYGGVTVDGAIGFIGDRVGSKIVDLKTGRRMGEYGPSTVRSPDGAWVVQLPNLSWDETSSKDVLLKNGANGQTGGKADVQVPDDELYGQMKGAFCGTTRRFILSSGRAVAAYALPSGKVLASFPAESWRDASADEAVPVSVACSARGTRVAILSGTRLTFHDLK